MKVPYLDLKVTNKNHSKILLKRFKKILDHGRIIEGPEVKDFENKISNYLQSKYAVGLSSGSSALFLALQSLNIGPGSEVITTPFTWIITINSIIANGARPVFADINDDLNIDPNSIIKLINNRTKAIVPMHVGGHMCDMELISKIAKDYNLEIIEDAAQAICGSLNGKKAGSWSKISAFSMNPMKMLNAYGECGVATTSSKNLYKKLLSLRHAGTKKDIRKIDINRCYDVSLNHKIDTLQASFLIENLKNLPKKQKSRDKISKLYDLELNNIIDAPQYYNKEIHGRYLYIFTCNKRDKLYLFLKNYNIESKIFYSPLALDAPVFKNKFSKAIIPNARRQIKRSLAIPMHENMSMQQVEYVINKIKKFYKEGY